HNLQVLLNARALRLETNPGADVVRAVAVGDADGRRFRVAARVVVLAAGGIENPRLLLCSDDAHRNGLGHGRDLVARFFMEHPFVDVALEPWPRVRRLAAARGPQHVDGTAVWAQLALSPALLRQHAIAGMSLWMMSPDAPGAEPRDAAAAPARRA